MLIQNMPLILVAPVTLRSAIDITVLCVCVYVSVCVCLSVCLSVSPFVSRIISLFKRVHQLSHSILRLLVLSLNSDRESYIIILLRPVFINGTIHLKIFSVLSRFRIRKNV